MTPVNKPKQTSSSSGSKTDKLTKDAKSVKASQVAFELEQQVARHIQQMAAGEGLTPSNQIRKLLGLTFSAPKRPRLTVSLAPSDYEILGEKYGIDPSNTLEIKRQIMDELIQTLKPEDTP